MPTYNLVAISGSLRKGSHNTALLRAFKERAPEGVSIELLDISGIPLYNQDEETNFPPAVKEIKDKIRAADGVIIATPEYNRSVPGVLKNAIDWVSRPYGDSAWNEKPVFVAGASGGAIGTALAQSNLKETLSYLNTRVPGQPEFYLGSANTRFDENAVLIDETTKGHIDGALSVFTAFIDKLR